MTTKLVPVTEKRKPPAAGKGRPKGSLNKTTTQVKEMVLRALDGAGGIDYLVRQADENPASFMTLVGKVIPTQVGGVDGDAIKTVHEIRLVGVPSNGDG